MKRKRTGKSVAYRFNVTNMGIRSLANSTFNDITGTVLFVVDATYNALL